MDGNKDGVKDLINSVAEVFSVPKPTLGIDIDGCIDVCPISFQLITRCWPGDVVVVSYRNDRGKATELLSQYAIRCDELILVNSLEAKAQVIVDRGILVFFDDQPESLKDIPETVNVMLVRNGGNFDFKDRRWLFSHETGKYAYFNPDHFIVCPRCKTQLFADQSNCYNCGEDCFF